MSLRPGWLITVWAMSLSVSVWLPWRVNTVPEVHHVSAIGSTNMHLLPQFGLGQIITLLASVLLVAGAMIGQGIFPHSSAFFACVISGTIASLVVWYYRSALSETSTVSYGFYLGAVFTVLALLCSLWAFVVVMVCAYHHRAAHTRH